MNSIQIKKDFHNFIDSIDSNSFLENFYELMKNRFSQKDGLLWHKLNSLEKKDIIDTYNKSINENELIDNNAMKNKLKKWL